MTPGDDQLTVGRCIQHGHAGIGVELVALLVVFDNALGSVRRIRLNRRANVLGADTVAVEREGQQLHSHGRQRGAAELDITDTLHLRQLLLNH